MTIAKCVAMSLFGVYVLTCCLIQTGNVSNSTRRDYFENRLQQTCMAHIIYFLCLISSDITLTRLGALEQVAKVIGIGGSHGARCIKSWAKAYERRREPPTFEQGRHIKSFTLLSNTDIRKPLLEGLRERKWTMTTDALAECSKVRMLPEAIGKPANEELTKAMLRHLEVKLIPCILYKVIKSISMHTAQ